MNSKEAIDRIMKVLGLGSQKFYEAKTDQGVPVKIDGDLEIGAPIYVSTEEGMILVFALFGLLYCPLVRRQIFLRIILRLNNQSIDLP